MATTLTNHFGRPIQHPVNPERDFVAPFKCPRCGHQAMLRRRLQSAGKRVATWCVGHRGMVTVDVPAPPKEPAHHG